MFSFWNYEIFRREKRISANIFTTLSKSSLVVLLPKLKRMLPRAKFSGTFIAFKTWLTIISLAVQALPAEA